MNLTLSILATPFGACLGSYAATAGLRLSRSEQSTAGRSHCDGCGTTLGFAQTVPIVSFIHLKGACADCGERIDPVHLVGEIAGAAIVACAALVTGPLRALIIAGLGLALLASSVCDWKSQRLPDQLTLVAACLGAALALLTSKISLGVGCAVSVGAFVLLEIVRRGFLALRGRPGLGFGDVKLISALAIWLGLAISWTVAIAAMAGLIFVLAVRPREGRLAFGPFIAASAWVVGLFGEAHRWPA